VLSSCFIKCDLSANLSTREGYGKINKILSTAEPDIQSVMSISHVECKTKTNNISISYLNIC
jgi:hypothetical protein